jgi:predicted transcriptional regulator
MADDNTDIALSAIELATEITIAWLGNPNTRVTAEEVPAFLKIMHSAIGELAGAPADTAVGVAAPEYVPVVPVRSSVKPDYIISLIDGRKLKSLKRHLSTHGLTPREYRERYGLKPDYPMVAASYSAQRREVAQKLGLGRKGGAARANVPDSPAPRQRQRLPRSAPEQPRKLSPRLRQRVRRARKLARRPPEYALRTRSIASFW